MRRWAGIVFCVVAAWACRGNADFSDVMPEPVILSAEEYREEISSIDRLVFTEGPFDEARRNALAGKLDGLARRMKTNSDSRFIAIEVLEVRRLAEVAKRVPAKPPASMLSNQWMRIRSNVFDDRSWFARSAADLEPLPSSTAPPAEVSLAKPEPAAPSRPAAGVSAAPELEGRWRVKELYGNGKPINDPEQSGAVWEFAGNRLSMKSPAGASSRFTVTPVRDARGTALWMQSDDSAAVAESGWMIYELVDGTLKVAFQDGLGDRPESFEPPADRREPLFVMLLLRRESGAPGAD